MEGRADSPMGFPDYMDNWQVRSRAGVVPILN
jgi:hypothetical protein